VSAVAPLIVCVLLVAANALFVAAEFSLVTVDRATVQERAEAGDRRARVVRRALRTLSTQLSGAQLGITISSLVVGFLAEPAIASLLDGPLRDLGLSDTSATAVSIALALAIATAFQMVLGELVPKNVAIAQPLPVARAVSGPQVAFTTVAGPLIRFLNGNANWVLLRFGIQPQEELASARSPGELASLVRRSAEVGTLPGEAAHLVSEALAFGSLTAGDVLTPRSRVRSLPSEASVADLIDLVQQSGLSRLPLTGPGGLDDIQGIGALRLALRVPADMRAATPVTAASIPPILVPESIPADELLARLREGRGQLAIVVDEYGGTAGVASLEDLVEELVGEVTDEHDPRDLRVRPLDGGALLLSGLLRPDELHDLGVGVPDDDAYDTLAGYITHELGRLAHVGDRVDAPGWTLTVQRMDGRRIDVVRAEPTPGGSGPGGSGTEGSGPEGAQGGGTS
jgi:CBS domain containing-hemolysin-like protein